MLQAAESETGAVATELGDINAYVHNRCGLHFYGRVGLAFGFSTGVDCFLLINLQILNYIVLFDSLLT